MTSEETIKMLTAKVECMKRESSGIDQDCNYRNCDECKLCYEQGTVGEQREALQMAISALQELKNSSEELKNSNDCISRKSLLEKSRPLAEREDDFNDEFYSGYSYGAGAVVSLIEQEPSAQPEPLSDAYMNAVWTWLLDYQIKAAELKGRYTPYEVLSWVANDWRKEHG